MGFFDFVKEAGAKLGLGGDEPEQPVGPTPEEVKRLHDRRVGMGLVKLIETLGFAVGDLSIRVDGDQVTVSGLVESQEVREKVVIAVGNTAGIARVDDQLEVQQPTAVFYTVVAGDTLGAIAKQHYDNVGKYPVIFEANRPMLEHPDKIYPGQVLRIPPLGD